MTCVGRAATVLYGRPRSASSERSESRTITIDEALTLTSVARVMATMSSW